jgi:Tol biopolymer transport system component
VLVDGVNGTNATDRGARLSPDELTVYFHSDRGGGSLDLYTGSRSSRAAAFSGVTALSAVNDPSTADAWPTVTADGLSLFFEAQRTGVPEVWIATRSTVVAAFSSPAPVANVGSMTAQPFVMPDGSALYFIVVPGDLYRAERGPSGQYGTPVMVTTVNTPSLEYLPVLTPDELTLYFGSNRADPPAKGDFDIWMSTRASRTDNWQPPVNVQELNTAAEELPTWISSDNCRLYFNRGSGGPSKVFVAERAN